ncbi:Oidioi.mRNA.OKI2018_I69.chr1.g569.t1.cds [Oikopleura dioica]|uniref:Oidioi.mRNA.OKI2018_I69.chr1.g569.t1.cds n=1 Tax=Oikopleura dioica TaxID=34765 RepID=A0ABN7SKR7_OIKDI|nr:Oidioi.mRNA.OKI2018_I69.chr1.g569.t1.cds [Oikopleura dioica]
MYCLHFGKFYVRAWDAFTKQSLKTKRYFDQIEKGEIEDYNALLSKEDADAIYRLPRVIAIKIFSFLNIEEISICRAVSREWNIITQAPSLWSTIDYSVCRHQVSDYAAKRHAEIARLYLSKLILSSTILETSTYRAFAMCRNVQHLNLSGCRFLTDEQAVILLDGFRALLTLDLSKTSISDTTIRALSKYGTNLQVLSLAYCTNFTTKGLLYLSGGEGCRMLKFLDMSGCLQISTQGFAALASLLNYLKSLILNDLYSLEDEAVQVLSILRETFFRFNKNCPQIGDDLLRTFGGLRSLRDIDLSCCPCITDAGVRHLVDGPSGGHLTHLNLSSINSLTDVALYRITSKCHKLIFLDMSYNERITDSGFELLSSLHKLQEFKCRGSVIGSHGASVIGKIRSIRKLDFAECQRLEDLEKITKNFNPDLTHLNFSIIRGLTNNGIKHLAFNCRNLESIRIAGCPELTDVAIQYIAGVCRFLKHIDVSGLPHVSDRSVKYLKKGCRNMNHLQAKYSSSITKEAIEKAKKWFANVEFCSNDPPLWWQEAYERIDRILEPPEGWPAADLDPVSKSVNAIRQLDSELKGSNRPQTTTGAIIDKNAKAKELQELRFSIADSPQFCLGQYRNLKRAHRKPKRVQKQLRPVTAPTSPLPPISRPRSQMSM